MFIEIIDKLLDYRIDYNLVSGEYFKKLVLFSGVTTGLVLVAIILPFCLKAYNLAEADFKQFYPKERIIYTIKNSNYFIALTSFIVGASIGLFIFPFIVFENLYRIGSITIVHCCLLIPGIAIAIYGVLLRYTMVYILSDRQICLVSPYKIFQKHIKPISIKYCEITGIKFNCFLFTEWLTIYLKNAKKFEGITTFTNLKEAKAIIKSKIET